MNYTPLRKTGRKVRTTDDPKQAKLVREALGRILDLVEKVDRDNQNSL